MVAIALSTKIRIDNIAACSAILPDLAETEQLIINKFNQCSIVYWMFRTDDSVQLIFNK